MPFHRLYSSMDGTGSSQAILLIKAEIQRLDGMVGNLLDEK
jgi:hypothetical protein